MANTTDWLNISAQSGSSGTTRLTITARRNTSLDYKLATITAYNPVYNITAKTYVTLESYAPYLAVSPTQLGVPASGGTYELAISGNCEWVIAFPDMVSSYSTSAGTGDTVVTFTIPATQCASTVVANIVVTDETGQISRLCRIEQYAEPISILYNPLSLTFPYYGGPLSFSVSANCMYSIASGQGDWYTFTPDSGTTGETDFTVTPTSINSTNTDRTGTINIVGPEGVAAVLMMTQLNWGQYHIDYTADTSTIDYSGETRTITIDATDVINSSITVEVIGAPDVTYSYSASGLTRGIVTLTVPQNPGGERNFTVVVSGRRAMSQNVSSLAIQYTQAALQLDFVTDTSNVRGSGEVRTITILNSNINPNRTGLNLPSDFPQQGSYTVSGNVITLTYPANPSSSATRTWTIGVVAQTNDGVSLSGSYQIAQNPNVVYSIPYTADTSTVDATGETRIITIDASNLVASSITVGVVGATGVSATYYNGTVTVVFPENTGFEQYVTVTVDGITTGGSSANATINYVQDGEYIPPTGDSRVIVIYDVTGTTSDTPILYLTGNTNSFSKAEVNGSSAITMSSSYRFNSIGRKAIFYTLKNDVLGRIENVIRGDFYGVDSIVAVYIPSSVTEINIGCFLGCSNLTSVTIPDSVTIIKESVFSSNSLTGITLPNSITTIGGHCFAGCSYLTAVTIPDSVTSIGFGCFSDCTSLTTAVIGSGITKLGDSDYQTEEIINYTGNHSYAFCGCTSLTSVTFRGQVTEIGNHCFRQCTSLRNIGFLPSTVERIGTAAFLGCDSLSSVTLPLSTTFIGDACFSGCTAITNVTINDNLKYVGHSPDLAIGVGQLPDGGVFIDCTSISSVTFPESLKGVGANSFKGCSGVTFMKFFGATPPKIKQGSTTSINANSFGSVEYSFPFYVPCSVINDYQTAFGNDYSQRIQCFDITATSITLNVASAITDSGITTVTVLPAGSTTNISYSSSNSSIATVDSGGQITVLADGQVTICAVDSISNLSDCKSVTVQKTDLDTPLTFEIITSGKIVWKTSSTSDTKTIQYIKNGGTRTNITSTRSGVSIPVVAGDIVQFYGDNVRYGKTSSVYNTFNGTTCQFKLKGNIMSLLDSTGYTGLTTLASAYTFSCLFSGCTSLVDASNLFLPATTLANYCYRYMFQGCTSLTSAPELPATTLADYCYTGMFSGCTSLTTAPVLPATTLAYSCYWGMFYGCSSLTTAPELPATTLEEGCYWEMFRHCTNLTTPAVLPATTLTEFCYEFMFDGCTALTTVPELPATTLARSCYNGMFANCTSLTTAPELPATTLADWCYYRMFAGCTNLNYIKCLATDISASDCTVNWVNGVASAGTFVTPSSTNWTTGNNGIPNNWTRVDA